MCLPVLVPIRDAGNRFPAARYSGGNSKLQATPNGTRVAMADPISCT